MASKIQQRNAKAQAAYESIRELGKDWRNDLHELFSVESQSWPGFRYTVTLDLVTGYTHCTCPHGVNGGRGKCVHRQAVERKLAERAVEINKAADEAVTKVERAQSRIDEVLAQMTHQPAQPRSREDAEWERDTAPLRRRGFSFMAR